MKIYKVRRACSSDHYDHLRDRNGLLRWSVAKAETPPSHSALAWWLYVTWARGSKVVRSLVNRQISGRDQKLTEFWNAQTRPKPAVWLLVSVLNFHHANHCFNRIAMMASIISMVDLRDLCDTGVPTNRKVDLRDRWFVWSSSAGSPRTAEHSWGLVAVMKESF